MNRVGFLFSVTLLGGTPAFRRWNIQPLHWHFSGQTTRIFFDPLIYPCRHFLPYCQHS